MPVLQDFIHDDPFVTEAEQAVFDWVAELSVSGYHGDPGIDLRRARPGRIDLENPATRELLDVVPGAREWLSLVPTAAALEPLYNPMRPTLSTGAPISPAARELFANLLDARGIRSRAAALRRIAISGAMLQDRPTRWLSLACGAAETVLVAAAQIRELGWYAPHVQLLDYDPGALRLARRHAAENEVTTAQARRLNILDPRGIRAGGALGFAPTVAESYDLVEAIGLLEYLKADDWTYRYSKVIQTRKPMAGARTFLANAWRMVRPGGLLVVANMLPTHPQLGFTLNVIQWPHIQPRSVGEVNLLLDEAGIVGERVTVTPEDGVYAVYTVRKPG